MAAPPSSTPSLPWGPLIAAALASGVAAAAATTFLLSCRKASNNDCTSREERSASPRRRSVRNATEPAAGPLQREDDAASLRGGSESCTDTFAVDDQAAARTVACAGKPQPGELADACAGSGWRQTSHRQTAVAGIVPNFSPINYRQRRDPSDPRPRTGSLTWDDYFMALAFLSAERSKDPNKQVGAVIVNGDNVILGIGYNGFPRGCCDNVLPWAKAAVGPGGEPDPLATKYPYVVHAEANALLNKNIASTQGARIYVTMFPCNECAKLLIQAGVREVVYHEAKVQHNGTASHAAPPSRREQHCSSSSRGGVGAGHDAWPGFPTPSKAAAEGLLPGCCSPAAAAAAAGSTVASPPAASTSGQLLASWAREDDSQAALRHTQAQPQPWALIKQQLATTRAAPAAAAASGSTPAMAPALAAPLAAATDTCYLASLKLLNLAGVGLRQHRLTRTITIPSPSALME